MARSFDTSVPDLTRVDATLERIYSEGTVRTEPGGERSILPEGLRRAQGDALSLLVEAERASRTIETGFAVGLSGLFIVRGALRGGSQSPDHLAIDPKQTTAFQGAGRQTFEEAGVASALTVDERGSECVLPELLTRGCEPFDFGFIDGRHHFEFALIDLFYMTRLVRPGALIAVDDVWMPSVRAAVEYFVSNIGLVLEAPYRRKRSRRRLKNRFRQEYRYEPMAILRVPESLPERSGWHFTPFRVEEEGFEPSTPFRPEV